MQLNFTLKIYEWHLWQPPYDLCLITRSTTTVEGSTWEYPETGVPREHPRLSVWALTYSFHKSVILCPQARIEPTISEMKDVLSDDCATEAPYKGLWQDPYTLPRDSLTILSTKSLLFLTWRKASWVILKITIIYQKGGHIKSVNGASLDICSSPVEIFYIPPARLLAKVKDDHILFLCGPKITS